MAQIKSEAAYRAAMKRIDELLKVVNDSTPADDPSYLELDMISDMVAEYENTLKIGFLLPFIATDSADGILRLLRHSWHHHSHHCCYQQNFLHNHILLVRKGAKKNEPTKR